MPRPSEEDLFQDTTMTFGEHLEELRTCLFKAIIGLTIGFAIGLYFASDVVDTIQQPLRRALTAFEQKEMKSQLKELQEQGKLPSGVGSSRYEELVFEDGLIAEEVFVDPKAVVRALNAKLSPEARVRLTTDFTSASEDGESAGADIPENLRRAAALLAKEYPEIAPYVVLVGDGSRPLRKETDLIGISLWRPVAEKIRVTSLNAHEAFTIWIKAALVFGAIIASPWIFYQIWSFVAAGLYPHEKHYVHLFLPFSLGLFFSGAALAFFFVFEPVLGFLFKFNAAQGIAQDIRISEWLSFVLMLPLGFGISFQLPLVMLFLERIGIFDIHAYVSKWRVAILVICIIGMMLTPADPYSMLLMAIPLSILYFGGILLCKWLPKGRNPFDPFDEE